MFMEFQNNMYYDKNYKKINLSKQSSFDIKSIVNYKLDTMVFRGLLVNFYHWYSGNLRNCAKPHAVITEGYLLVVRPFFL